MTAPLGGNGIGAEFLNAETIGAVRHVYVTPKGFHIIQDAMIAAVGVTEKQTTSLQASWIATYLAGGHVGPIEVHVQKRKAGGA